MPEFATIENAALNLLPDERAMLAQSLLLSLDSPSLPEIEKAWLDEAERRALEIDRGEVELISGEEVRRKARALFK